MPEPLDLPDAELPIDPYVLGVWLGDGRANGGAFTKGDEGMAEEIRRRGFKVTRWKRQPDKNADDFNVWGLRTALRDAGLLNNKHVPDAYLRGSIEQRLDLLRGLMDSDGTWNRARKSVCFYSCDKALALAVKELATSLGERPIIDEVERKGFGLTVTSYDVKWTPVRFNPFLAPVKADRVVMASARAKSRRRMIVSIEETVSVPTQCIAVDSPDRMYLAGEQMVPTHNTGREPDDTGQLGTYRVGLLRRFGIDPRWGAFWLGGSGSTTALTDLRRMWPEGRVDQRYAKARRTQLAGDFTHKPSNLCGSCGVRDWCPIVGGAKADEVPQPWDPDIEIRVKEPPVASSRP